MAHGFSYHSGILRCEQVELAPLQLEMETVGGEARNGEEDDHGRGAGRPRQEAPAHGGA